MKLEVRSVEQGGMIRPLFAFLLSVALIAYNALVSFLAPELVSIPIHLVMGLVVIGVGRRGGLSAEDMGLSAAGMPRVLGLGALLGATALAASFLLSRAAGESAMRFGAGEVTDYEGWRLALKLVFQIPIATALVEELAFRGVLFAAWARASNTLAAGIGSSGVFALWHIPSTLAKVPSDESLVSIESLVSVALSVAGTLILGLALVWLRVRTGSVWAGVPFHAGFNAGGLIGVISRA